MTYVTVTESGGKLSISSGALRAWQRSPFAVPDRVMIRGNPDLGVFELEPTNDTGEDTRALTFKGSKAHLTCAALHSAARSASGASLPIRCPARVEGENGVVVFDAGLGRQAETGTPIEPGDVIHLTA